jgi:hypothetical protein
VPTSECLPPSAYLRVPTSECLPPSAYLRVPTSERLPPGEPRARRVMAEYTDRLARALASVINLFDPHVIVLGGGMSNVDALYDDVPARWAAGGAS